MQRKIELLPFDTDIFGYRVGRICLDEPPVPVVAAELRTAAVGAGFRLLYLFWPGETRPSDGFPGLFPAGGKREFTMDVGNPPSAPATLARCTAETAPLRELAAESGRCSRFFRDPGFSHGEFGLLYDRWLRNCFDGTGRANCFVAGDPDDPDGFVTLDRNATESDALRIGLLAVHPRARRRGVGSRLVAFARRAAADSGYNRLLVATQSGNAAATALYLRSGFQPISTVSVAHLWINPFRPIR